MTRLAARDSGDTTAMFRTPDVDNSPPAVDNPCGLWTTLRKIAGITGKTAVDPVCKSPPVRGLAQPGSFPLSTAGIRC
jgi:hypothetical protein